MTDKDRISEVDWDRITKRADDIMPLGESFWTDKRLSSFQLAAWVTGNCIKAWMAVGGSKHELLAEVIADLNLGEQRGEISPTHAAHFRKWATNIILKEEPCTPTP